MEMYTKPDGEGIEITEEFLKMNNLQDLVKISKVNPPSGYCIEYHDKRGTGKSVEILVKYVHDIQDVCRMFAIPLEIKHPPVL